MLTSCGYFSDEPVKDSEIYRSENLSKSCEINTKELSKIMEKDVEVQINCLENNLEKFTKYVKRENADAISSTELSSFIRRFFTGHTALMAGSVKLMFNLGGLLLNDDTASLKIKNIRPLFDFLRRANKQIYRLNNLIIDFNEKSGDLNRVSEKVKAELSDFIKGIQKLIEFSSTRGVTNLNLKNFILQTKNQFSLDIINMNLVETFLSLKSLFLGGDREVLTQNELMTFLGMVPDFGALSFKLYYANIKNVGSKHQLYALYKDQLKVFENYIYPHQRDEVIITRDEVYLLVDSIMERKDFSMEVRRKRLTFSTDDVMKISDSLKSNILGRNANKERYSFQEVNNLFRVAESALGLLSVNEQYKTLIADGVNKDDWRLKKTIFLNSIVKFKDEMISTWANNEYFPTYMSPIPFINDVIGLIDEDFKYKDILSDIIGIGKVSLVGGRRGDLYRDQLVEILFKLEGISNIAFNVSNANEENHSKQEIAKLRFQEMGIFLNLLDKDGFLHLLTTHELISILSQFKEDKRFLAYTSILETLKAKLLGGYRSSLTIRDFKAILKYIEDFYGERYFAGISYDLYEKELSSPDKITNFKYTKNHNDFNLYPKAVLENYKEKFSAMITKIRLYRDEKGYQFYGDTYRRTKVGLLEHYAMEFAFQLMAQAFGHKDTKGKRVFNLKELNTFLATFKPILKDFGVWSKKPKTFGRNTLLLADLFQANSDGSLTIDSTEVSEYGALALFAIKSIDELSVIMDLHCSQYTRNGTTGYHVECYRKYFFDIYLNKLGMAKYLPRLNRYIKESSKAEVMDFLLKVEGFAKLYHEPGMPEMKTDMINLIGAMLNIESTFLRYDTDKSNLLEANELNNGFPVYKSAIISVAKLSKAREKYAKTIFLYMIKNMEKPSMTEVLWSYYNPLSSDKVESKRINIGALLYNMVMNPTAN